MRAALRDIVTGTPYARSRSTKTDGRLIQIVEPAAGRAAAGWRRIEDVDRAPARSTTRIAHLAHYDALTDLPNRVLFRERLDHAAEERLRRAEQLAVLYIDIDEFKGINDSLGHHDRR